MAALVGHSLVIAGAAAGVERHGMLETVREYAQEALAASGDEDRLRERHARFFLTLAQESKRVLVDVADPGLLDRLAADHDNLRAALGWLREHDVPALLRMVVALRHFWQLRGHLAEGHRWIRAALEAHESAGGAEGAEHERAGALHALGVMCHRRGDHDAALAAWTESHALCTALGDASGAARSVAELGNSALVRGDLDAAERHLEDAAAAFRALGDDMRLSTCLCNLSDLALQRGVPERALGVGMQALRIDEARGSSDDTVFALNNVARAELALGIDDRAKEHLTRGLALAVESGYAELVAYALHGLADLGARRGRASQAALLIGAADERLAGIGAPLQPVEEAARAATLAVLEERLGAARLAALRAEGAGLPDHDVVAIAGRGPEPH